MSFHVRPEIVYGGSLARKSSPEPKTVCYSPRKRPENAKTTSFDVTPETVNRGSPAKTVCYSPRKRPENEKTTTFDVTPETLNRGSLAAKIVPRTENSLLLPTKMAKKCENDEF